MLTYLISWHTCYPDIPTVLTYLLSWHSYYPEYLLYWHTYYPEIPTIPRYLLSWHTYYPEIPTILTYLLIWHTYYPDIPYKSLRINFVYKHTRATLSAQPGVTYKYIHTYTHTYIVLHKITFIESKNIALTGVAVSAFNQIYLQILSYLILSYIYKFRILFECYLYLLHSNLIS